MRTANQILDQEYLQVRAKILEVAAFFDRLQAAGKIDPSNQSRLELLQQGCHILLNNNDNKAAQVQLLFSRAYDSQWRDSMNV